MKKIIKTMVMSLVILITTLGCTGCYEERIELYKKIDEIEKNPNYTFVYAWGYFSSKENISFPTLVKEKIKSDGKNIGEVREIEYSFIRYEGDIAQFYYRYEVKKQTLGRPIDNNCYAIGTISYLDYSISMTYYNCKYDQARLLALTEEYNIFSFSDTDYKQGDSGYPSIYLLLNRITGEIQETYGMPNVLLYDNTEKIPQYSPPTVYTENGINYEVSSRSLTLKTESGEKTIMCPMAEEIIQKSTVMQKIVSLLKEVKQSESFKPDLATYFLTNGEDLFVAVSETYVLYSFARLLHYPIIFKCDSSLESFEYIDYSKIITFTNPDDVEIRRNK